MKRKYHLIRSGSLGFKLKSNHKIGNFTNNQVPGAYENGTKFEKINSELEDKHVDGDKGIIIGSILHEGRIGYFVNWIDDPNTNVFIVAEKIRALQ